MFYKITKELQSPIYQKLIDVFKKRRTLNKEMIKVGKELSDLDNPSVYGAPEYLAGRITGIQFSKRFPGWKKSHVGQSCYMPMVNNKKMWDRINNIPVLKIKDISDILKFSGGSYDCTWIWCPHVNFVQSSKTFLIKIHQKAMGEYVPHEDMEEITYSEFMLIKNL